VVDVINTSFVIGALPAPQKNRPIPVARFRMGDDYLFGSGHVYLGV
jgi:hypothetical protein